MMDRERHNKILVFFFFLRIVLQCNSKDRIALQHYCKKICNTQQQHFLMQYILGLEMPNIPYIWQQHSPILRASTSENSIIFYFTISKSHFITYTEPFYNTSNIPKFYFTIQHIKIIFLRNKIIYPKPKSKQSERERVKK